MELILSEEQRLLYESAGRFFAQAGGVKRARGLRGSQAGFDRDGLRAMGGSGWLGMLVSEDRGGPALGPRELALVLQQAGRVLAPEPIAAVAFAALAISESDNAAVRDRLLPPQTAGESVIVPALQDASGAIDLGAREISASRRDGEWRLNGSRGFVLGAGGCDGFLVGARDPEGAAIFHVPRAAGGLSVKLSPTVDGRAYGELTFHDVPARDLIARGNAAAATLERLYHLALVASSAEMLGVMEGVNERTLDYMKTRKQFGRAIGSFQALQHRAVDNYVLIEGTRSLLHQICEGGEPVAAAMASALKAVASSAALTVTKSAVQLHGAIGFTDEYDVGLYLKRAMWLSAYLGNEAAHRRRYASLS
jgi:alkylation response protein AidB-like acyl-CoA dehydrogenase